MPDRSILCTHANAVGLVHTASTACSPGISAVDEVIRAGRVVDEVALMHWLLACSCLAVSCSQALLQARCASDVPPGRTAVSRDMIYHISQLLGLLLSVKLESACHCHRERAKCAVLCTELEGQESLLQVNTCVAGTSRRTSRRDRRDRLPLRKEPHTTPQRQQHALPAIDPRDHTANLSHSGYSSLYRVT